MSNIETLKNDTDFIMYKTTCDCMDDEHDLTLCIEKEHGMVALCLYQSIYLYKENLWQRIKLALSILLKGRIQLEGGFIFRGKDHIKDLVDHLNQAVEKIDV